MTEDYSIFSNKVLGAILRETGKPISLSVAKRFYNDAKSFTMDELEQFRILFALATVPGNMNSIFRDIREELAKRGYP